MAWPWRSLHAAKLACVCAAAGLWPATECIGCAFRPGPKAPWSLVLCCSCGLLCVCRSVSVCACASAAARALWLPIVCVMCAGASWFSVFFAAATLGPCPLPAHGPRLLVQAASTALPRAPHSLAPRVPSLAAAALGRAASLFVAPCVKKKLARHVHVCHQAGAVRARAAKVCVPASPCRTAAGVGVCAAHMYARAVASFRATPAAG